MELKEIFEKMKTDYLNEDILGEFYLLKDHILWSYELTDNLNEEEESEDDDYNEEYYNFDSTIKEKLLEIFNNVFDSFELFLDSIGEYDNWMILEPVIYENMISVKIV